MVRARRAGGAVVLVNLALALGVGVARAQEADDAPTPEAVPSPEPTPVEPTGEPAGEPAPGEAAPPPAGELTPLGEEPVEDKKKQKPRWAGPAAGEVQLRLVWQDLRLPLCADDVRGTAQPVGTRQANRHTDYDVRHTSARLEGAYGLALGDTIGLELYGGLGWGTTALSVEADRGSVLVGNNGHDVEATMESTVDFDLALGANVQVDLGDLLFVGGGYQFLYSHTTFDDQTFYDNVDGRLDLVINDLSFRVGVHPVDFLSVWGGLGFTLTWGDLNLEEQGGNDRWDLELDQGNAFFKGLLGFSLHPGEHLAASFEVGFIPDPSYRIQLGWSF